MNQSFQPLFQAREPLRVKLRRILIAALDLYLSGPDGPRGCFTVLSAASEAIADPDLHSLVAEAIEGTDRAFGRLFADARENGRIAGERRSEAPRAHGLGDPPYAVDPRPRPHSKGADPADCRGRGDDDLRRGKAVPSKLVLSSAGPRLVL